MWVKAYSKHPISDDNDIEEIKIRLNVWYVGSMIAARQLETDVAHRFKPSLKAALPQWWESIWLLSLS